MTNEIYKLVISQGIFAALFFYLLYYVLDTNNKREENYQEIIKELSQEFKILEVVCNDVNDIKLMLIKESNND